MEMEKIEKHTDDPITACSGYCCSCGRPHSFPGNYDVSLGIALMEELEKGLLLDTMSIASLFGEERGKMFGVMTCLAKDDSLVTLKAFSGQFDGRWQASGWVPPLFDVKAWEEVNSPAERTIKELGRTIDSHPAQQTRPLRLERRHLSRCLMKDLHALYRLTNFWGRTAPLTEIFPDGRGIPTGTGDCCAPKLLNYAAGHGLLPLSMCEFYWGLQNRSGSRQHRNFYLPCAEKCGPLLGFLLCGLEERYAQARS